MSATLFGLVLCLAAAPARPEEPGWKQPPLSELSKVFGVRFIERVGERPFLARKGEEWTAPYISRDHTRVYSANNEGVLEARNIATGERVWLRRQMGSVGASMAEHDGRLLLSSGSTLLALDDASGVEKWKLDLGGGIAGRMVLTGTVALIPVRPNHMLAVDVAKGALLWRAKRPTPEGITMRGQAPAAVDRRNDRVFIGFSDGAAVAVSFSKGEVLWAEVLAKAREAFVDVDAQPVVSEDGKSVLFASIAGGVFSLDAATGRTLWKHETRGISSMVKVGELLVAGTTDGQVLGLSPQSGKVRWRFRFRKGAAVEPIPLGHGQGLVLVGNVDGASVILDGSNGKPVDHLFLGSGTAMPAAWRDPDLAVLSNHGLLLVARYGSGGSIHRKSAPR